MVYTRNDNVLTFKNQYSFHITDYEGKAYEYYISARKKIFHKIQDPLNTHKTRNRNVLVCERTHDNI